MIAPRTCPVCHSRFVGGKSCLVIHKPGTCCHVYQTPATAEMSEDALDELGKYYEEAMERALRPKDLDEYIFFMTKIASFPCKNGEYIVTARRKSVKSKHKWMVLHDSNNPHKNIKDTKNITAHKSYGKEDFQQRYSLHNTSLCM